MAIEQSFFKFTAIAGENMSTMQHTFVMLSADDTVLQTNAPTDKPCGILQNSPALGQAAEIMVIGISKILAGAANLVAGNLIGCNATGGANVIDPDAVGDIYYVGQVIIGALATEFASALINCATGVLTAGS